MRIFLGILSLVLCLQAHESWLLADQYRIQPGDTLTVFTGNGHYFPASVTALAQRLIAKEYIILPGGEMELCASSPAGKARKTRLSISTPGLAVVVTELSRKPGGPTQHWLRSCVEVGEGVNATYRPQKKGLEIVPLQRPADWQSGNSLHFRLLDDGQPLRSQVFVSFNGNRSTYVTPAENGRFQIDASIPGTLLMVALDGPRSCSLTLELKP